MKNKISIIIISLFMVACSKQAYYDIPKDGNGNVILTDIATCTTPGITTLEDNFTVYATLPNAKAGDVMTVELLKPQIPPGGTTAQLLPLAGTQKQVTVGSDLKASVNFTRVQAQMNVAGDGVTVTFAGKTESASIAVTLKMATIVSGPEVNGKNFPIIRSAGTAYWDLNVNTAVNPYTGTIAVYKKNGMNDPWISVGDFASPSTVPVSGDEFAVGKDTMYYVFVSNMNSFTDSVFKTLVADASYFFFKKSGTMALGGATAGLNPFVNGSLVATDPNAVFEIDGGSLTIHAGSAWAVSGKSISFVPASLDLYSQNDPISTINAYSAGTPTATADPALGEGVYIFQIVNGPNPSDVYYGILKITQIVPGTSFGYEYRIGYLYSDYQIMQ